MTREPDTTFVDEQLHVLVHEQTLDLHLYMNTINLIHIGIDFITLFLFYLVSWLSFKIINIYLEIHVPLEQIR